MNRSLTPHQAKRLAHAAFIYGYSMVENYRMMYQNFIDADPAQGFNELYRQTQLATPEMPVVTPNNDTLYTQAWLDLRAEPYVLSVPAIPKRRYYSFQNVDYFTNNFIFIGTREEQFDAANYLLPGPDWQGPTPAGIAQVIQSPSQLYFLLARTQVLGKDDLPEARAVQDQYRLTPLSRFTNQPAPPPAPALTFPRITADSIQTLEFFTYLNMGLTNFQGPQDARADRVLMEALAVINVGPGKTFDPSAFSTEIQAALVEGIESAYQQIGKVVQMPSPETWVAPNPKQVFGTSWAAYWLRAVIARGYIYMVSPAEAMYPKTNQDALGAPLTGKSKYTMTFEKGGLPPAQAFWSVTMYSSETMGLVANEIDRYSLGSSSVLAPAADGSITLYFQQEAPSSDRDSPEFKNWLPAPSGDFYLILRVYLPTEEMLDGAYVVPDVVPEHLRS